MTSAVSGAVWTTIRDGELCGRGQGQRRAEITGLAPVAEPDPSVGGHCGQTRDLDPEWLPARGRRRAAEAGRGRAEG
ncbi:hypothetical protein Psuf_073770 [Phytohabitans suffuscus]|uniref:Uncharacterized protein n=1 Tax=Phytohabitans suffuscus TaxID=624315 RepID=A0A6F8YVH7_9ACTN|nr:hypothetical protein Psuf_073770 [Phytohabitans suffuscus]